MCATVSSPGRMHPILPFVGEMLVEVFERDGRANEAHEPQIEGYDRGLFFQASSSGRGLHTALRERFLRKQRGQSKRQRPRRLRSQVHKSSRMHTLYNGVGRMLSQKLSGHCEGIEDCCFWPLSRQSDTRADKSSTKPDSKINRGINRGTNFGIDSDTGEGGPRFQRLRVF